jgi:hydrogenase/urease accessory protein HupE
MTGAFVVLIPVALGAVTLTLFVGIYALFRGGSFGEKYSNKLMQLRVLLQFVAIAVVLVAVVVARGGHV